MKGLKSYDISTFLEDIVISQNRNFQVDIFPKMFTALHCHCRMPDDGQLMIQCSRCKSWFHQKCEKGDFTSKKWNCMSCSEVIKHVENRKLPYCKQMEDLIQASKHNADNTATAQLLYQSIRELILPHTNLPSVNCAIGCVSQKDIIRILPTSTKKHKLFGLTVPLKPLNTFCICICILPETFQNKQILLEVVVHEIAHALHALNGKAGYPHGEHF